MQLKIQSIHFDADKKLLDFIQQKLDKLDHYFDGITGGEVFLKLENARDENNKVAEIKLLTNKKDLFAKSTRKTFEEAVNESADALRIQVKKHKEKLRHV